MLVPGLNGVGAFWARQVPDFARDFRVVVHDHRGTGQSTHSRIRYSVEQMAADVLCLMDRLGIASALIAGHSTGGAIGQVIAQDHPDRLQSLVLSATWPGPDPYFRRLFEARKQTLRASGMEAYLAGSALVLAPPWWVSANDAILAFDRRARMREIRVPTLVVVAADDMVTPPFYSRELADGVPGAKLVVLDGGGHFVPSIFPDQYNAVVGGFLRSVIGR